MVNQITYLIGAGASYDSLPIVNGIADEMLQITNYLQTYRDSLNEDEKKALVKVKDHKESYVLIVDTLISDIRACAMEIDSHASADTYAKKLFLKNSHDELIKLKTILSICFIIIQHVGKTLKNEKGEAIGLKKDKRYDSFFASILSSIYNFPKNIRILSWNYDHQFELAYSDYYNESSYERICLPLGLLTKRHNSNTIITDEDRFSITKLNGSTGFTDNEKWWPFMINNTKYTLNYIGTDKSPLFKNLISYYIQLVLNGSDNVKPLLSFAWEEDNDPNTNILQHSLSRTKYTSILVIIGYSFPYFNREIDSKIINNMELLSKVYIQDPNCEEIAERFDTIYDKNIHPNLKIKLYNKTGQFLFPNELDL